MTRRAGLSSEETARYSRHIILPEIGLEGQERLKASRVLVLGAGGLGSPVALYLAAAGVGTIGLADFDKVEAHNLQRQILHGTSDVGTPKTASGRRRLSEINPHVGVVEHVDGVRPENAVELFAAYDLVVDGTDNFPTRYLNTDAAFLARRPLVYGSIFKFEGQVTVFDPHAGTPCYRCLFPEPPPPGSVPNCGEAGVLGALCGVVGSIQAMEAIKRLAGVPGGLDGRLLVIDALGMQFRTLKLRKDPDCPLCGARAAIRAIDPARYAEGCAPINHAVGVGATGPAPAEVNVPFEIDVAEAARLAGSGAARILDVREPFELQICRVAGSAHIPMAQVPRNLDQIPRDAHVLVLCHHGGRSARVTQFLRQNGYDKVSNIAGGVDAWARQIEPGMQRY
ncbi:MAG: molybdopterin-synthase adenylyltransferase MoeB [Opitutaceae bacterium]|nr:molybdopterin-synthase adenylyltransferase MoeB [Opitutaceae bacterium]